MSREYVCLLVVITFTSLALPGRSAYAQEPVPVPVPVPVLAGPPSAHVVLSPWSFRLVAGAAYVAGSTTTDYRHPNPAIPRSGHFGGAAAEIMATL
jgi:hypothetical protein